MLRCFSWRQSRRLFERTGQTMLRSVQGLDAARLERRVLIRPMTGLEDSSRFWSASMVFDHVLIVGEQIRGAVVLLSHGLVPDVQVNIAEVKPAADASVDAVIGRFEKFVTSAQRDIEERLGDRRSKAILRHPWFGSLDCCVGTVCSGSIRACICGSCGQSWPGCEPVR